MSTVLPALVLVPLLTAAVVALLAKGSERAADVLCNIGTAVTLGLALSVAGPLAAGTQLSWNLGGASPLGISLSADALSLLMLLVVAVGSLAASVYSVSYMRSYSSKAKYYVLLMLMVTGMNIVVLGADIVNMYVGIEVAALACYALVAYGLGRDYLEASFKYQVLGTVGTLCLIAGMGLMYGRTGTLSFGELSAADGVAVPAALLLTGLALKAAFVPFHAWLPDAHSTAPSPDSALLSLLFVAFAPGGAFSTVLLVVGGLSILAGALLALMQGDMKRLLAYCTISQMGYVLLGLAVGTPLALVGALFHLVNHALFKELFFFGAGSVERQAGTRDIAQLGGLNARMPVTGVTSAIGFFSVSGCPPFNGFWSKLIIIVAAVQAGFVGAAVVAAVGAVVTIGYFLKYERGVFFGALPQSLSAVKESPVSMYAPMVVLAIACIALGLAFPWFIDTLLEPAVQAMMLGA